MDDRVVLTVASIIILAAWWFVDILIDQIETRNGPPYSWLAGVFLFVLLSVSGIIKVEREFFAVMTGAFAVGLVLQTIYYLRIRKH